MKQSQFYYLLRRGLFGGGGNPALTALRKRVIADGGIFEGFACANRALSALPQADAGRLLFEPFNLRVVADGGETEARTCTINAINALL